MRKVNSDVLRSSDSGLELRSRFEEIWGKENLLRAFAPYGMANIDEQAVRGVIDGALDIDLPAQIEFRCHQARRSDGAQRSMITPTA